MGRPKGSKNKAKVNLPTDAKELDAAISEVRATIDRLTGELSVLSCDAHAKRREIASGRRELAALEAHREQLEADRQGNLRREEALLVADAFLSSGKSVEEALEMFRNPA